MTEREAAEGLRKLLVKQEIEIRLDCDRPAAHSEAARCGDEDPFASDANGGVLQALFCERLVVPSRGGAAKRLLIQGLAAAQGSAARFSNLRLQKGAFVRLLIRYVAYDRLVRAPHPTRQ